MNENKYFIKNKFNPILYLNHLLNDKFPKSTSKFFF